MIADAWDELQRAAEAHTKSYDGPRTAAEQEERLKAAAIAYVRSLPMPRAAECATCLGRKFFYDEHARAITCPACLPALHGPSAAYVCVKGTEHTDCGCWALLHAENKRLHDLLAERRETHSSGVARDRARAFIEAEAITSEAYGADIIVVGRTFEDALVALLETETQVSRNEEGESK